MNDVTRLEARFESLERVLMDNSRTQTQLLREIAEHAAGMTHVQSRLDNIEAEMSTLRESAFVTRAVKWVATVLAGAVLLTAAARLGFKG